MTAQDHCWAIVTPERAEELRQEIEGLTERCPATLLDYRCLLAKGHQSPHAIPDPTKEST